ncbi:glycerate kinase [Alicyclobacillus dauci]|uniref:Glycerate kinase n=1 Tax=Alicyclobacillus dauci TaxID=1475485 RepID=A0ABY6Z6Y9_9BACL|nr:glycerate kinase [Alicyclobacillus dauci]WAH37790.1 glycerate kinase [Alicyclobacillus dauci]
MNIVIAPDSYKGSLSALEVGQTIERAMQNAMNGVQCDVIPMADGGEGTMDALVFATDGQLVSCEVMGPLLKPTLARYGVLGNGRTVVIEMAQAVGLPMIDERDRNPMNTSTYGVGQLLRRALDDGYRDFVVGIGGSATNDGGIGFLTALGAQFFDVDGKPVELTGRGMTTVAKVDLAGLDSRIPDSTIRVACDVENELTGDNGASAVFGPQKGADAAMIRVLDDGLKRYASLMESAFQRPNLSAASGAGAAGGMGFALMGIDAELVSGAELVGDACHLRDRLAKADVVVTGEGRSDTQTLSGKVPYYVAKVARELAKPVILISGSFDPDCPTLQEQFTSIHAASCGPASLKEAMQRAEANLYAAALNVAKLVRMAV